LAGKARQPTGKGSTPVTGATKTYRLLVSCTVSSRADAVQNLNNSNFGGGVKRKANKTTPKPKYTPKQVTALMKKAIALYHAGESHAKQLGFVLIEVKNSLKHGDFKKWLAANRIDRNHASYAMRLAGGKQTTKLPYVPKPEKLAEQSIKKVVAKFVKLVGNSDNNGKIKSITLDEVSNYLLQTIGVMIANVGKMRKWPIHDPVLDPKVAKAGDKLRAAVNEFLDAAFEPVTLDDLEEITNATNPRASDYARALKENQAAQKAADNGAATASAKPKSNAANA
jgi:hypothetical protein